MTAGSVELRVGGRVWFDGQGWEIAELDGATARLLSNGRLRAVSITSLLTVRQVDLPDDSAEPDDLSTIPAVVVAGLSTRQRSELQRRVELLRQLIDPLEDDDRSVADRYAKTAAQLGVTKSAEQILESLGRLLTRISGAGHY